MIDHWYFLQRRDTCLDQNESDLCVRILISDGSRNLAIHWVILFLLFAGYHISDYPVEEYRMRVDQVPT